MVTNPNPDLLGRIAQVLRIPMTDLYAMACVPAPKATLPNLRPYMRAKYANLTSEQLDEVERFIDSLAADNEFKAPLPGEDEN